MTGMKAILAAIWRRALMGGVLALVLALMPLPAQAQAYMDEAGLERAFALLKNAPDELNAEIVAQQIWYYWLHPNDPELAAAMIEVLAVRAGGDYRRAITLCDAVIARWPDYAEGWNQRATLYYIISDLQSSLADVEEVLAREPRHFGALSGAVAIYLQLNDRAAALQMAIRGLAVHPFLSDRRYFPELLQRGVEI